MAAAAIIAIAGIGQWLTEAIDTAIEVLIKAWIMSLCFCFSFCSLSNLSAFAFNFSSSFAAFFFSMIALLSAWSSALYLSKRASLASPWAVAIRPSVSLILLEYSSARLDILSYLSLTKSSCSSSLSFSRSYAPSWADHTASRTELMVCPTSWTYWSISWVSISICPDNDSLCLTSSILSPRSAVNESISLMDCL